MCRGTCICIWALVQNSHVLVIQHLVAVVFQSLCFHSVTLPGRPVSTVSCSWVALISCPVRVCLWALSRMCCICWMPWVVYRLFTSMPRSRCGPHTILRSIDLTMLLAWRPAVITGWVIRLHCVSDNAVAAVGHSRLFIILVLIAIHAVLFPSRAFPNSAAQFWAFFRSSIVWVSPLLIGDWYTPRIFSVCRQSRSCSGCG